MHIKTLDIRLTFMCYYTYKYLLDLLRLLCLTILSAFLLISYTNPIVKIEINKMITVRPYPFVLYKFKLYGRILEISRSNGRNKIATRMNDTENAIRVWLKLDKPHSKGPNLSA